MGTRPAATLRIVSSLSVALATPSGICREGKITQDGFLGNAKRHKNDIWCFIVNNSAEPSKLQRCWATQHAHKQLSLLSSISGFSLCATSALWISQQKSCLAIILLKEKRKKRQTARSCFTSLKTMTTTSTGCLIKPNKSLCKDNKAVILFCIHFNKKCVQETQHATVCKAKLYWEHILTYIQIKMCEGLDLDFTYDLKHLQCLWPRLLQTWSSANNRGQWSDAASFLTASRCSAGAEAFRATRKRSIKGQLVRHKKGWKYNNMCCGWCSTVK